MEKYKQRISENRALKKYFDIPLGGRRGRRIEKEMCTEDVQSTICTHQYILIH
jgi:signal recognition particle subunit SEC65